MDENRLDLNKPRYWIFTFGFGQRHAGKYVKIFGTYGEARRVMFDRYGYEWFTQYAEETWNAFVNDPKRDYELETELEVIE